MRLAGGPGRQFFFPVLLAFSLFCLGLRPAFVLLHICFFWPGAGGAQNQKSVRQTQETQNRKSYKGQTFECFFSGGGWLFKKISMSFGRGVTQRRRQNVKLLSGEVTPKGKGSGRLSPGIASSPFFGGASVFFSGGPEPTLPRFLPFFG